MKVAENQPGELITMFCKHSRGIAIFSLIIFTYLIANSCSYYKKKSLSPDKISIDEINKNLAKGKQFLLVSRSKTWEVDNIKLVDDKSLNIDLKTIERTGRIADKLSQMRSTSKKRVRRGNELMQQLVIIYLHDSDSILTGNMDLAISDIAKIEVYNPNVAQSVLVVVIPAAIVAGTIALIASSGSKSSNSSNSSSSCPFLYAYDGENYQLAAETFGGAIYPGLERSDFVKLPMAYSVDGIYKFKIKNELEERQYINKVRIIEAKVPSNKSLNIDQRGIIHTIDTPVPPIYAATDSEDDYTAELTRIDGSQYYFNEDEGINTLTLNFTKNEDVTTGKLILRAKNTIWLDYVFGEFLQLFGVYYNTFTKEQKKKTKAQMRQWYNDQYLPLTVSIYKNGQWAAVEQIEAIGPLAEARDIVVPLDLVEVSNENLKVRLSSGFLFWEVDYAAMDYSADEPIEIKYASPELTKFNSIEVTNGALNEDDSIYIVEDEIGDVIDLKFARQFDSEVKTTVFLEVRGYYTHIRDFKTAPDFITLQTFRTPGRLSEFSYELYHNYMAPLITKNVTQE